MYKAIETGDIETVKYLLNDGFKINSYIQRHSIFTPYEQGTPLINAIIYERFDIFKLLIDYGADINMKSLNFPRSPLHFAISHHLISFVKLLIKHSCEVDNNYINQTPLMMAIESKSLLMVKYVAKNIERDINGKDINGEPALKIATRWSTLQLLQYNITYICTMIKYLIDIGCDTKIKYYSHSRGTNITFIDELESDLPKIYTYVKSYIKYKRKLIMVCADFIRINKNDFIKSINCLPKDIKKLII